MADSRYQRNDWHPDTNSDSYQNRSLTSNADIQAIFADIDEQFAVSAMIQGFQDVNQRAVRIEDYVNTEIDNLFKELVTSGAVDAEESLKAIDVSMEPGFVSDGFYWADLTDKYLVWKLKKGKADFGDPHFFFMDGLLRDDLEKVSPRHDFGGALVTAEIATEGVTFNSFGQPYLKGKGSYVKYSEIEYVLNLSYMSKVFEHIESGLPPELLLPREISKKLLGKRRKDTETSVAYPLQKGALRPILVPLLYWFDADIKKKLKELFR